ncbi:hypothetical protein K488DRAFT_56835 [Vararia minispora EC-137]|uniref:Uncharacterized protein n=1 Tax=Vararia minispora EC-137 TaxID=1314806 RepID=A0ACB8QBR0_9AGAM|nr:hypothetical protein K488DRAFT_56835 [Vararia minispora EC-137]
MTSSPPPPMNIPPYQLQALIETVIELYDVKCAQALGSEIFVGCSNGDLLRFVLQANEFGKPNSYSLLSRQSLLPQPRPIDEIVLLPSISRMLVYCDRQIHFYTLPSLNPVPSNQIKPIRNVVAFAVDHQHIQRPVPPPSDPPIPVDPVDFCVVKRSAITLYSLHEQLYYQREIPLPSGAFLARRSGEYLCIADRQQYAIVNLRTASLIPLMPISQAPPDAPGPLIRPVITVVSETEFLILSWNGASTMGLFITGEGDPVRGTLEFPAHPVSVCLDHPYLAALLPDQTIQVHSIETQSVVQTIPAPPLPPQDAATDPSMLLAAERRAILPSAGGFLVPSQQQSSKLLLRKVRLLGRSAKPGGREEQTSPIDLRDATGRIMASVRGPGSDAGDNVHGYKAASGDDDDDDDDEGAVSEPAEDSDRHAESASPS